MDRKQTKNEAERYAAPSMNEYALAMKRCILEGSDFQEYPTGTGDDYYHRIF